MAVSWTARLAARIAVSQLITSGFAQDVSSIASAASSIVSSTPTASEASSVASASPSSTGTSDPKVHLIQAGAGGFKFTPQEVHNVSVGDIITWEFYPPDHSVARAEFGSACVPYEYTGKDKVGFWSETQWVNNTNELTYFNITVNDTAPIFFYCAAPNSCIGEHMVGVINPNSTQTLASQVQAAAAADFQVAPGDPIPAEATSTLASPSGTSAPTSSASAAPSSRGGSHTLSTGAIVGIAIGGVAFLIICAALFFFVGRSKSLKEVIKRQDATNGTNPHMSQNYGNGGLASPGFQSSQGHMSQPHGSAYGFSSPPQYGQHGVSEQYPSGWGSPPMQQGHLSMLSNVSGMSQQQIDQLKYAQTTTQPAVAELHSPPLEELQSHQETFASELEAPGEKRNVARSPV